jgi:hypothetical protein
MDSNSPKVEPVENRRRRLESMPRRVVAAAFAGLAAPPASGGWVGEFLFETEGEFE